MTNQSGQFLSGKRIIVAGGGFAGMAFVAALGQLWDQSMKPPEITVFEQETRERSIVQNDYMLTINGGNQDGGLVAIQQLGLLAQVRAARAIPNSGEINVWSDSWKKLASISVQPYGELPAAAMRIRRQDLKRIILSEAEKTADWRYSCTCTGAERLANGKIRVTISNTEAVNTFTQDCDLLIAADGPSSTMRQSFRPNDMELRYAGATQIGGTSYFPGGLPTPIHADYGLQMSSGEGVCCIYTPFDDHAIGWALSRVGPKREARLAPLTQSEFTALKSEALATGVMFQEPFKSVIEATDPATAFVRPAMEKPAFPHDAHLRNVVFIGDANHILGAYELRGADHALKDGWDLAEQICQSNSIEAAVAAYDKLSIPRFEHVLNFSHERIRFGHSTGFLWKLYKYGMAAQRALAKK